MIYSEKQFSCICYRHFTQKVNCLRFQTNNCRYQKLISKSGTCSYVNVIRNNNVTSDHLTSNVIANKQTAQRPGVQSKATRRAATLSMHDVQGCKHLPVSIKIYLLIIISACKQLCLQFKLIIIQQFEKKNYFKYVASQFRFISKEVKIKFMNINKTHNLRVYLFTQILIYTV